MEPFCSVIWFYFVKVKCLVTELQAKKVNIRGLLDMCQKRTGDENIKEYRQDVDQEL